MTQEQDHQKSLVRTLKEKIGQEIYVGEWFGVTIEIQEVEKPACIAETLARVYF